MADRRIGNGARCEKCKGNNHTCFAVCPMSLLQKALSQRRFSERAARTVLTRSVGQLPPSSLGEVIRFLEADHAFATNKVC